MKRFEGKVALVTGGRSGIGRAITEKLEAEGARVFTAQRQVDRGRESIQADFDDAGSIANVIPSVIQSAGRLDVLINNAGMMREFKIEEMSLADWGQDVKGQSDCAFSIDESGVTPSQSHGWRDSQHRINFGYRREQQA